MAIPNQNTLIWSGACILIPNDHTDYNTIFEIPDGTRALFYLLFEMIIKKYLIALEISESVAS